MMRFEITFVPRGSAAADDAKKLCRTVEAADRDAAFAVLIAAYPGATVERIEEAASDIEPVPPPRAQAEHDQANALDAPVLRAATPAHHAEVLTIGRAAVIGWLAAFYGLLLVRLVFRRLSQPRRPGGDGPTFFARGFRVAAAEPPPSVMAGHLVLTIAAMLCLAIAVAQSLRRLGVPGVVALPLGLLPLIVGAMVYLTWETSGSFPERFSTAFLFALGFALPTSLIALALSGCRPVPLRSSTRAGDAAHS